LAEDVDGDPLFMVTITAPAWLVATDEGNGSLLLSGTPSEAHLGSDTLIVQATAGGALTESIRFVIVEIGTLQTTRLVDPPDATQDLTGPVELSWRTVPGSEEYRIQIATATDFSDT